MINFKNLNKSFGTTNIYVDANYSFKENKLTCFLGPSGSGKTTLLNLLAGFDSDFTGEININNINIKNLSKEELCEYRFNNIGFIFQQYNLLKGYTALENVLIGINLNENLSENEKKEKAKNLLIDLGLTNQINQRIETLSGGEKQRVAIARALINNPKIILADEPTGALDEESTKSIMKILKKISKNKTVIVITHDDEVATYADEIIELNNFKINTLKKCEDINYKEDNKDELSITHNNSYKAKLNNKNAFKLSLKNFKIHIFKYIIGAFLIAFGAAAFVGVFSSKAITNNIIEDFKNKNLFYNKGQAPHYDNGNLVNEDLDKVYKTLNDIDGIENIYYQYDLENIMVKNGEKTLEIPIKVPTAISKESLVYGNMPKDEKNEIAISSNVANRLNDNIENLIGKEIALTFENKQGEREEFYLTVSGVTNSIYQDFIVSSKVEKEFYEKYNIDKENPTAVAFQFKNFEDIPNKFLELKENNIGAFTKSDEIESFKKSFTSLLNLYTLLSYLTLLIGTLISCAILYKIAIDRYTEIGLLGALGYTKKNIQKIMFKESIYFAAVSTSLSLLLIFVLNVVYKMQFGYGLNMNFNSFLILLAINLVLAIGLPNIINSKLIKTEPAIALKK